MKRMFFFVLTVLPLLALCQKNGTAIKSKVPHTGKANIKGEHVIIQKADSLNKTGNDAVKNKVILTSHFINADKDIPLAYEHAYGFRIENHSGSMALVDIDMKFNKPFIYTSLSGFDLKLAGNSVIKGMADSNPALTELRYKGQVTDTFTIVIKSKAKKLNCKVSGVDSIFQSEKLIAH